jgi:hypothetical protein
MIHRQTAAKVACGLLSADVLPPDVPRDFSTFLTLCERLVAYFDHGVTAALPAPEFNGSENVPFGPGPHPDDDIPY